MVLSRTLSDTSFSNDNTNEFDETNIDDQDDETEDVYNNQYIDYDDDDEEDNFSIRIKQKQKKNTRRVANRVK